ncbi:MAG: hypothetical protein WCK46_00620 [Candidatus Adlerbacteria bacterium]
MNEFIIGGGVFLLVLVLACLYVWATAPFVVDGEEKDSVEEQTPGEAAEEIAAEQEEEAAHNVAERKEEFHSEN